MAPLRLVGRPRWLVSTLALLVAASGLVLVAVRTVGFKATSASMNNGSVWVTNLGKGQLGRVNEQLERLDAGPILRTRTFDVLQHEETVIVHDLAANSLLQVDTAYVRASTGDLALPRDAVVRLGGRTGAVLEPATGKVWTTPAEALAALDTTRQEPVLTVAPDSSMVVGQDGVTHVLDATDGTLTSIPADPEAPVSTIVVEGMGGADGLSLTTVGAVPVVFDGGGRRLVVPGRPIVELGDLGSGLVVQQPGPAAADVVVASDTRVALVPLRGGPVRPYAATGTGAPAAPVRVGACVYAAWATEPWLFDSCRPAGDDAVAGEPIVDGIPGAPLVFRVNRSAVALNAPEYGPSWLVASGPVLVNNWDEVQPNVEEDEQQESAEEEGDEAETTEECLPDQVPPVAADDAFGARPGQTTVLPVLANDADANCDPVVITEVTAGEGTVVDIIEQGQALQFTPAAGQATARFSYTIDDGNPGTATTAQVTVTVVPLDVNRPPTTLTDRPSKTVVEQGRTVVYDPLVDWIDPDGDPLVLQQALATTEDTVRSSPEGSVTFTDAGTAQGRKTVELQVSDGRAASAGRLFVDVQPRRDLPPRARNDFATTVVGRTTTLLPLLNDTDPNGDQLLLAEVQQDVAGAVVTFDPTTGQVAVTAERAGTYVFRYRASANGADSAAFLRVDVRELGENHAPVPVRDVVVVTVGLTANRDVVANDLDLDNDVLVVVGLDVPLGVRGLTATVIDHAVVRVALTEPLAAPAVVGYRISDGAEVRQGSVIVLSREGLARNQPPDVRPDVARVRAGDIVDIPVLANDVDADGDRLTLVPSKLTAPAAGFLFAQGDRLRYRAPDTPGTYYATYVATDGRDENSSQLTISVKDVNDRNQPPLAVPVVGRVLAGGTVRLAVPLAAMDPDGDSLVLTAPGARTPGRGRVVRVEGGTLVYRADPSLPGTDEFTYVVDDGRGGRAEGAVRIGIAVRAGNQSPVAINDSLVVLPGRRLRVDVLANDIDPDGDELTFAEPALEPAPGVVATLGADGKIEITSPSTPGTVNVGYTIVDGQGGRASGFLSVTAALAPPPQPPVAVDDVLATLPDPTATTLVVPVRDNDEDPNGERDALVVSLPPGQDAVAVTDGSTVTVTLGDRPVKVAYTVTDTEGLSASAFVVVPGRENQAPRVREPLPDVETAAATAVVLDIDDFVSDPEGAPLQLTTEQQISATGGEVRALDPRRVQFTPAESFQGEANVTFEVADRPLNDPAVRTLKLTVPVRVRPPANLPPAAGAGTLDVEQGGTAAELDLRPLVTDPNPEDVATLTFGGLAASGAGVDVTLRGSVLVATAAIDTPKGVVVPVTYVVSDGEATATGSVAVRVTGSTRPLPRANPDEVAKADQGRQGTIDPLANDAPSPSELTVVAPLQFDPAQVTATTDGRTVTYTPATSFVGTAVIRYRIQDRTNDPDRQVTGQISINVRGRPDAPSAPTVEQVRDRTVVLQWQPRAQNGAPILDYQVTAPGYTRTCPATTCTLDDLTNNVTYQFQVTARNEVGTSDPSPTSAPARPDVKPGQVSPPVPTFGDRQITLAWTAPPSAGSPITAYDVEVVPGGEIRTATATNLTWTGLTNGQPYSFRIRARNSAPDPGDWSDTSQAEVPAGVPDAPAAPVANTLAGGALGGQATVTWTAPANNGATISPYTLVVIENGVEVARLTEPSTSRTVATTNGATYSFKVVATNKAGNSPESPASAPSKTYRAPDQITNLTATPGNGQATLAFTPPNDGGNPITRYRVRYGGTEIDLPANRIVTGLAPNTTYTFQVSAFNGFQAPFSAGANALVYGNPLTPGAAASAGGTQITFSWSPPSANGLPIADVQTSIDGGGWQSRGPGAGSQTIGFGYSQTHTIAVRAVDSAGQIGPVANASARTADPPRWFVTINDVTCPEPDFSPPSNFNQGCPSGYLQIGNVREVTCWTTGYSASWNGVTSNQWYRMTDGWYVWRPDGTPTSGDFGALPSC